MSAQQLITENIDLWTSAVKSKNTQGRGSSKKRELYGIKKLRELILELAVRGKLVSQDSNDEPAILLLERIATEKAQLIQGKKIKKQKPLPEITDDEKPFEQPAGWEWARFQAVAAYIQRGKGPNYADSGDVQVVSQKCIQWTGFDLEPARYVEDSSLGIYQEERFLQSGDLLWNSTGTGTVGRINLLDYAEEKTLVADSHVTVIRPLMMDGGFLRAYISAPGVQSRIEAGNENALVSGSTKQVELNTSSVIALPIPVPSIDEQHRIVAKVDELMALCDQLEQQTESSLDAHNLLVDTLLAILTDARDAHELNDNWARLAAHFDTLITTDYAVEQLKQTILQLAVHGKLVPQNPNDEPASELLKRIAVEKVQLIKDKKIKKQKSLPEITDEEKLYQLPDGWDWLRFGQVAVSRLGKMLDKAKNKGNLLPYLRNTNVQWHRFELDDIKLMKIEDNEIEELLLRKGDLLICEGGHPGRCAIWKDESRQMFFQKALHRARPLGNVLSEYLQCCLTIDVATSNLDKYFTGATIKHFVGAKLNNYVIPIPPVEEQHRIVTKVNDLMTLCDQLKAHLSDAQTTQLQLADTVVDEALN